MSEDPIAAWKPTDSIRRELSEAARHKHRRVRLASRMGGYVIVAVLSAILPAVGENGTTVAFILLFIGLPTVALIERYAPAPHADNVHAAADVVFAAGLTILVPAAWHAALVIATAPVVMTVGEQRLKVVLALAAEMILAFSLTGWMSDIPLWHLSIAGLSAALLKVATFQRIDSGQELHAADRLDELVSAASAVFWEIDSSTAKFVSITGDVANLLGYSSQSLIEESIFVLISEPDTVAMLESVNESDGANPVAVVAELRHVDGRSIPFRHLIRKVDHSPFPIVRGVSFDIAELQEATETIRHQAQHDSLTNLKNRAVLESTLSSLTQTKFGRSEDAFALLLIDLDHFKEVNDTLGHQAGDALLCSVADRLSNLMRDHDVVARLGGDEFAIVLTNGVTESDAIRAAERITASLSKQLEIGGMRLTVHASIGVALAPSHGDEPETLMRRADIAMYEAKRTNKPYVVHQSSIKGPSIERLAMSNEIAGALDRREFELWFQPKVDLISSEIVGAEGLVRWRHPQRGVMMPGEFLEWVTIAGEYHRLSDFVLSQGVAEASRLAESGHRLDISVNVSVLSLLDETFPDRLAAQLNQYPIDPEQLTLEITESDALGDMSAGVEVIQRLGELGVGLSIDDFGTGHSSLSRLRHLPVTEVKIDRSFVGSMLSDTADLIIVRSIIALARDLGHRTVGEGVEDSRTAEQLQLLGCDQAQGFLFSAAVPAAELRQMLDQGVPDSWRLRPGSNLGVARPA